MLFLMLSAFLAFAGKMTTEVTAGELCVRFGWLTGYAETIPLADIQAAEAVQYDPLGEYGGWGIRGRGKNRALNQLGNEGVRLQLPGNKILLIGSQRPRELADAIARARQEEPPRHPVIPSSRAADVQMARRPITYHSY